MPAPKRNEGKQDFLKRCTSELIEKEKRKADQAFAMCNSFWNDVRGLSDDSNKYELSAELRKNTENDDIFITAHSGKVIDLGWRKFVINVNGIEHKEKIPLILEHNTTKRIGYGKLWKEKNQLFFKGNLLSNEEAHNVKEDMEEGFPMEASVGIWPLEKLYIDEGVKYKINGTSVEGPIEVWSKSNVRELSLTTLGVDDSTASITMHKKIDVKYNEEDNSIASIAIDKKIDVKNNKKENDMPDQKKQALTTQQEATQQEVLTSEQKLEQKVDAMLKAAQQRIEEFSTKVNALEGQIAKSKPQVKEAVETPAEITHAMNPDMYALLTSLSLEKSGLPEPVVNRLGKKFNTRQFSKREIDEEILDAKAMMDEIIPNDMQLSVKVTESEVDNGAQMLSDVFAGKAHSVKKAYQKMTGDMNITGRISSTNGMKLSLTTSQWTNVLADELNKQLVIAYEQPERMQYKSICSIGSAVDFRAHKFKAIGGYGSLPTVAEKGPYLPLTSPGDQTISMAVTKKGGTEDITIEMIKNDDVNAIRRIPLALGNAAIVTLSEFVFVTLIQSNPTFDFDSTAVFDAAHANYATGALAEGTLSAGRLAMVKQTELTSGKRLGVAPRFLLVPPDLTKTAFELTSPGSTTFTIPSSSGVHSGAWNRSLSIEVVEVIDFTDATNWYLFADPNRHPALQLIFLDGNENPEVFIQEMPNLGSMFSNDVLTWKIRHIYGGDWVNYRGAYGAIVAG